MDLSQINGKSVLVLGATGGLGSEFCKVLSNAGAKLAMASLTQSKLEALEISGPKLTADLRDPNSVETVFDWAITELDGIDVVINAVGVVAFGEISEVTSDTIEELFMTNTFLPIFVARQALKKADEGATVVNISGVIAEKNLPGMAVYGASKAAVKSFDEAFAREARRKKISIIDARPPHTETELSKHPIQGVVPKMPTGIAPNAVAVRIVKAIVDGEKDLPSTAFNV